MQHATLPGSAQLLSGVQDMIQNTNVNEVGNQAPTSTSTDAITNADNPIDKAAGQVCESESSSQQTCPTLCLKTL